MYISQDALEDIRSGNDIVNLVSSYVTLNRRSGSYVGLCPFHDESTPSFHVSPDKQLYYCFGCGATGNVISFVMAKENLDFVSSVKFLADKINYTIPENSFDPNIKQKQKLKADIISMNTIAARFFYDNLNSSSGRVAKEYLNNRKITERIQKKFGIGYSPRKRDALFKHLLDKGFDLDTIKESGLITESKKQQGVYIDKFINRVMFPIFDITGKIIGFGGRVLDDGIPKYLNSPQTLAFDKSKNLFALNFARKSGSTALILVEGYLDTISMHQAGFANTIASLGTAFNSNHAGVIRKYSDSVTILFDSDGAGITAALRAIEVLTAAGVKAKVLTLKGAKDPDEFIKQFGPEKLAQALENADNHVAYRVGLLKNKYNFQNTDEKIEFTYEVSKILSSLGDNVLIDAYADEVAKITNISADSIKSHIDKISQTKIKDLKIDNNKKKIYSPGNKDLDKGLMEASKSLIYIIAENYSVYLKVKDILNPTELPVNVYKKLLGIIYNLHEKKENIYAADIVSLFGSQDEQRLVSEIFNTVLVQDEYKLLEKALNEQIRLIKRHNIEIKIKEVGGTDIALAQSLELEKRNLNKLYITLIDG